MGSLLINELFNLGLGRILIFGIAGTTHGLDSLRDLILISLPRGLKACEFLFNAAEVFGQVGEKIVLDLIEELVLLPHLCGLILVHLAGHV